MGGGGLGGGGVACKNKCRFVDPPAMLQGCALAEPGSPWCLTFVLGQLENLSFFIEIICWVHWISQVQSTGLPSIFPRAQPCAPSALVCLSFFCRWSNHFMA